MRRSLVAVVVFLVTTFVVPGQNNTISFVKSDTIPNSEDMILDVLQLPDTGYLLAGGIRTSAKPFPDYLLVRTNKFGDTLWTKRWGTTASEAITTIAARHGGGFVAGGGNSVSFSLLDANCNVTATRTYTNIHIQDVVVLADSGFMFTGYTGGYPINSDVMIMRTDKNGDSLWTRHYGTIRADIGRAIAPTSDGNFVICGHANFQYFSDGSYIPQLAYVLKIDNQGDTLWTDTLSKTVLARSDVSDILENKQGQYVVAGWSTTGKALLAAWSPAGSQLWHKELTNPHSGTGQTDSQFFGLELKCDGGYIAVGNCNRPNAVVGLLVSTNSIGDTLFHGEFGSANNATYLRSIVAALDSGYFVSGTTNGTQNYSVNPMLVKTDAQAGISNLKPIVSKYSATLTALSATFKDLSAGALNWYWTFGDGATSTLRHPVHTYTAAGSYTVCLKVWNYCDTATYCEVKNAGVTSLSQHETGIQNIRFFPNPTDNQVQVVFDSPTEGSVVFRMYDISGRETLHPAVVLSTAQGLNEVPLDFSIVEDGVYFLEISLNDLLITREKVIKVAR